MQSVSGCFNTSPNSVWLHNKMEDRLSLGPHLGSHLLKGPRAVSIDELDVPLPRYHNTSNIVQFQSRALDILSDRICMTSLQVDLEMERCIRLSSHMDAQHNGIPFILCNTFLALNSRENNEQL